MYKIREKGHFRVQINAIGPGQKVQCPTRSGSTTTAVLWTTGRTSDSMLDLPDLAGTGRPLQINQRHLVPFHQTQLYNTEDTVLPTIWTLRGEGGQSINQPTPPDPPATPCPLPPDPAIQYRGYSTTYQMNFTGGKGDNQLISRPLQIHQRHLVPFHQTQL